MHPLLLALAIEVVAPQAALVTPFGVAKDRAGNLYICEHEGQKILKVDRAGAVTRLAGTGSRGYEGDNGPAEAASFRDPHGIVIGPGDRMYVADTENHCIRRIDLRSGVITTIAGTGIKGYSGDGGPAVKAQFNGTYGVAIDPQGRKLYVADLGNRRIRMIELSSGIITTVAGNGTSGVPADGARAAASPLVDPRAVAAGPRGSVYILERNGNALRVLDNKGLVRTLVAPGAVEPDMKGPKHLCLARDGSVIIADAENQLIRKYANGTLTTLDTGPLKRPHGVYVDAAGTLFIADTYNNRILKLRL